MKRTPAVDQPASSLIHAGMTSHSEARPFEASQTRARHAVARTVQPLPPTETGFGLPMLDLALDGTAVAPYLQPLLAAGLGTAQPVTVITCELLDHKPGKRGLLRYRVAASGERTATTVFGKIYAESSQLHRVTEVMQRLWTTVFAADPLCSVPQPLGLIPDLSMLLYLPAEGQFLDEVLTGERAAYAMEITARWLATLHHTPLPTDKHFALANEVANLATWAALVGKTYPALAPLARQLLHYLEEEAPRLPLTNQAPIHKDFHYRHVLVERGVKVIDFDELRLGDSNFDLAHFCANLHLLAYRRHGTPHGLRPLEQRFLDAYARQTGWSLHPVAGANRAVFAYFYVYTCLKIARQLCLGVGPGPVPSGKERRRQVQMILRQGVAAVA